MDKRKKHVKAQEIIAGIINQNGHRIRLPDLASHLADLIPVGSAHLHLNLLFVEVIILFSSTTALPHCGTLLKHYFVGAGETFGTFFECENLSNYLAHNDFFFVNNFAPPGQPGKISDTFVYINKCALALFLQPPLNLHLVCQSS